MPRKVSVGGVGASRQTRLVSASKKNDAVTMLRAMRNDLAQHAQAAETERDYVAIMKVLSEVTEKLGRAEGQLSPKVAPKRDHHKNAAEIAERERRAGKRADEGPAGKPFRIYNSGGGMAANG